jgi:hypothetical protein
MSGHITSLQSVFDKLFVKVVCTAFSVCSIAPTNTAPCFEAHRRSETSRGKNLQKVYVKVYDKFNAELVDKIERMSKVMLCERKHYLKDRGISFLVMMWPRESYYYVNYVRKIQDVWKMVGCNVIDGAIVRTWQAKLSDAQGQRKKGGVSRMFIHQWLILNHFVDVSESKIKYTDVSAAVMTECIKHGNTVTAINDSPTNVRELHKYITESNQNAKEIL